MGAWWSDIRKRQNRTIKSVHVYGTRPNSTGSIVYPQVSEVTRPNIDSWENVPKKIHIRRKRTSTVVRAYPVSVG